jgi:hypothetical protein
MILTAESISLCVNGIAKSKIKIIKMKKIKKAQGGAAMDPKVSEFLKKRKAADTTKMYNRGEMLETINAITAGKIKPRVDKPMAVGEGTKKYATVSGKDTTYMSKADFEKKYANKKDGGKVKKAKSGGSFPDLNKDGKITQADILKGRGVIKNGAALKKQAAKAIAMKKAGKAPKKAMAGKKMMGGGKCKNGC